MFARGLERDLAYSKWAGLADEDGGYSGHAKRWAMKCAMVLMFARGATGRERDLAYSKWACVDAVWPTVLERQDEEKRQEDRVGRLTRGWRGV